MAICDFSKCNTECLCKSCDAVSDQCSVVCTPVTVCNRYLGKKPDKDNVNHPSHYKTGGIETLDYIKAKLSPEQWQGYLTGNILKYISRYPHKNGKEDCEKARFYLDKLIESMEG